MCAPGVSSSCNEQSSPAGQYSDIYLYWQTPDSFNQNQTVPRFLFWIPNITKCAILLSSLAIFNFSAWLLTTWQIESLFFSPKPCLSSQKLISIQYSVKYIVTMCIQAATKHVFKVFQTHSLRVHCPDLAVSWSLIGRQCLDISWDWLYARCISPLLWRVIELANCELWKHSTEPGRCQVSNIQYQVE